MLIVDSDFRLDLFHEKWYGGLTYIWHKELHKVPSGYKYGVKS